MLLDVRRREIAVLRAVGVGRAPLRVALLLEAAVTGAGAAAVGVALAYGGGGLADRLVTWWLPDLPFRPERLVVLPWWLVAGAVVAGLLAAVVGAWLPVRHATRVDPAEGLTPR
jgi:ABC-type antimicrobial peptide transport system permease subunit